MKKKLLSLLLLGGLTLTAGAQYQVSNANFEQWEEVTYKKNVLTTYTGEEPVFWNSFLDGTGSLKSTAGRDQVDKATDKRPGSVGNYSAKITARSVLGVIAQGNLTTGCVNMGSMTATDASGNYNYSDTNGSKYQAFTGRPDAMRVWVKFNTSGSYKAKANAILHTAGYYQDPEANTITATVIAKAENMNIASTNAWQELIIPFSYHSEGRPAAALVSFSTSNTPGSGDKNDYMFVDDLEFLYYSQLSDLKYNGISIDGFNKDTYVYSVDGVYTPGCLSFVKNCTGGEVVLGAYDEVNQSITLTVKGDDISIKSSNYHTYTVHFVGQPAPELVSSTDYTDYLVVTINGENTAPQETTITVAQYSDGTYTLSLKNFMLVDGEDIIPVGNIVLEGMTATENAGKITFAANQTIQIQPGELDGLGDEDWYGPMLGNVPIALTATIEGGKLKCNIDIDMTETLGQVINVYFGVLVNNENAPLAKAQGVNVVLNRTFKPGWSTLALQYDVTKEALGATRVMTFDGVTQDALLFAEYTEDVLDGNYPYLVYFETEKVNPFFVNCNVYEPYGSQTHGDWTFCGTFTGIAAPGMEGKYGVTTAIDGHQYLRRGGATASIKGTRAYFEYFGSQNVQQMRINLDGENGATSIDGVQVLSGRIFSGMP